MNTEAGSWAVAQMAQADSATAANALANLWIILMMKQTLIG
jgi:hypothetical protein